MGQGEYKVDDAIEVTYQAAAASTGLVDVTMEIYDETHSLDGVDFPNVTMTEIGVTGRYYGTFTPDAEGNWTIMIDSATKPGKIVKKYSVTAYNINSVGDVVATTDGKVDVVDGKMDAMRGVDDDTLKTISDQIDNVASADSAPIVG